MILSRIIGVHCRTIIVLTHSQIDQEKHTLKNTGVCPKWDDEICMPQTSEYVCIHSTTKDPVINCHQDYEFLQEGKYISQEDMLSERTPQQYISETKETYLNEVNWPVNLSRNHLHVAQIQANQPIHILLFLFQKCFVIYVRMK
jgi:hypothetical protein